MLEPSLVQRFNVLCVTMRCHEEERKPNAIRWHAPITGIAETWITYQYDRGVWIPQVRIRFQQGENKIIYVRSGLDGSAATIAIERADHSPYDIWELYTDTPCGNCDPEVLRELAKQAIERRNQFSPIFFRS